MDVLKGNIVRKLDLIKKQRFSKYVIYTNKHQLNVDNAHYPSSSNDNQNKVSVLTIISIIKFINH